MMPAGADLRTSLPRALEALESLRREMESIRSKTKKLFEAPRALAEANRRLAAQAEIKVREPVASRRAQALKAWQAWRQGEAEMPPPGLLRALCWEPEVVSDEGFHPCLSALRPLRQRTILALLPAYLRLWRQRSRTEPDLARVLAEDLGKLINARGIVLRWQQAARELLGTNAAEAFAGEAERRRVTVRARLTELNLATDTEFARAAASALLEGSTTNRVVADQFDWLFEELLPQDSLIAGERGWGPALQNLILNEALTLDEKIRERILDFALRDLNLGDPRVDSVPWHPVGDKATREVIRWRSSEDLRLFFDLVMKGKLDHQGRHRFWQKYVDGVTRSLIVLSRNDEDRLRRRLRDLESRGRRFSRITGTNQTSAFVMEFGKTVIVEFSEALNACFVYENVGKDPVSWQAPTVKIDVLKNPRAAKERLIHSRSWEHEFESKLARRGIRPISARKSRL